MAFRGYFLVSRLAQALFLLPHKTPKWRAGSRVLPAEPQLQVAWAPLAVWAGALARGREPDSAPKWAEELELAAWVRQWEPEQEPVWRRARMLLREQRRGRAFPAVREVRVLAEWRPIQHQK